jgi:hypothetical protein
MTINAAGLGLSFLMRRIGCFGSWVTVRFSSLWCHRTFDVRCYEKISHGEPTFFTPRRVFAMFANNHHDDGHIAVWLPAGPGVQDAVIEEVPQLFFRPPYVGSVGCIGVEMAGIDDDRLGSLIREAFNLTAAKDRGGRKRRQP